MIKLPINNAMSQLPSNILSLSFHVTADPLKSSVATLKSEFSLETRPVRAPHLSILLRINPSRLSTLLRISNQTRPRLVVLQPPVPCPPGAGKRLLKSALCA